MGAGINHKRIETQLGDKRGGDCQVYGLVPHEKQTAEVWTRDMERRARRHATGSQHDSTRGRPRGRLRVRLMDTIGGHENQWNGGEGYSGSGK